MPVDLPSRFAAAIASLEAAVPALDLKLAPPASVADLDVAETTLGYPLPPELRALYGLHNGQSSEAHGLFGGLPFLSLGRAMSEWSTWRQFETADYDSNYSSVPLGAVVETYTHAGWFPITRDGGGNNLAVDTVPGPNGVARQVINFGRDESDLFAYAPSLVEFLERIVELAVAGRARVSDDDDEPYWGIDDAESGWPSYANFASAAAGDIQLTDEEWFATLDADWQAYLVDAKGVADFTRKTKFYAFTNSKSPVPVANLEPLARCTNLREVIIYTRVLDSLNDLPLLPDIRQLYVSTLSNEGIERYPTLRDYNGAMPAGVIPGSNHLEPLTRAPALATLRLGPFAYDLRPLVRCLKLRELSIDLHDSEQFTQLGGNRSLIKLHLSAGNINGLVDDLDWGVVAKLKHLTIEQGAISCFDFVSDLPRLTGLVVNRYEQATEVVSVASIAQLPRIEEVQLPPKRYSGVEAFASTPTLKHFSAGFDAFSVLKDLRPDLPFGSMSGDITDVQRDAWLNWKRSNR